MSAVIPTYNRSADVRLAVASVVAQTYPAEALEIVVVDDGGADDTEAVLAREFGDRVRYLRKPNGGVSAARNFGMAAATGELLALLDDDDEWRPTKIARQVEVLTARPEVGMVITDVERMDERRVGFEIFRRREFIPEDGWVLPHVLRNPALVPASAMLRRAVFTATGGFDAALPTAEDLDFHLRVAVRFQIAVVTEPLTRAMRGHQGLSAQARTNRDYVDAVERFVRAHADAIAPRDRAAALFWAYARNARGLLATGTLTEAARLALWAGLHARGPAEARELARLGVVMSKNAVVRARRRLGAA
ncbi:MAG: glycosyltransferase [Myxococcales bacterium]|nr:glycosyltransferase [Myxococcales bacterium]